MMCKWLVKIREEKIREDKHVGMESLMVSSARITDSRHSFYTLRAVRVLTTYTLATLTTRHWRSICAGLCTSSLVIPSAAHFLSILHEPDWGTFEVYTLHFHSKTLLTQRHRPSLKDHCLDYYLFLPQHSLLNIQLSYSCTFQILPRWHVPMYNFLPGGHFACQMVSPNFNEVSYRQLCTVPWFELCGDPTFWGKDLKVNFFGVDFF